MQILGYNFVCCDINCRYVDESMNGLSIKAYYISSDIPDEDRTDWSNYFGQDSYFQEDMFSKEVVNTYSAISMKQFCYYSRAIPGGGGTMYTTSSPRINTSNVTNMSYMYSLPAYTGLLVDFKNGIDYMDTSNVINMSHMFDGSGTSSINVNNWDTSSVKYFDYFVSNCTNLTKITGSIDLTMCVDVDNMFYNCNFESPVHLKNVPKYLDMSNIGGTENTTYIIDSYLEDNVKDTYFILEIYNNIYNKSIMTDRILISKNNPYLSQKDIDYLYSENVLGFDKSKLFNRETNEQIGSVGYDCGLTSNFKVTSNMYFSVSGTHSGGGGTDV